MSIRVGGLIELVLAFAAALAMRTMGSPVPDLAKGATSQVVGWTTGI
jgi:hypothetical protein